MNQEVNLLFASSQYPHRGGFAVFTQKLRLILERELHSPQATFDFSVHGSKVSPNYVGHDINVRRDALVIWIIRGSYEQSTCHSQAES